MTADTPYDWLSRVAAADPQRVCLVDVAGAFTYADVLERVDARVDEIASRFDPWEIVPVEVAIDVSSIIEILAVQKAGGVPLPYAEQVPVSSVSTAEGVAVCIATSGSSGVPKVVPLTYRNIAASVRSSRQRLATGPGDRWLLCLPLDHVGGLSIIWRTLEAGGAAVIEPFDPSGAGIERAEPTVTSMVPTMVHRLVNSNPEALASMRWVLVGGASLGLPLWEQCVRANVRIVPTYGLTEAGSQVATALPEEPHVSSGRVAKPLEGMNVVIIGPDGDPVASGTTGAITIDGPAVFDGYLGEDCRSGPFLTGDVGRFDEEGNLHVVGRSDDVVISGGENISLGHVAGVIGGIEGVEDVCVVGLDDAEWGTVGGAMVVTNRDLDSFDTMVRRELKAHERPKRWLRSEAIPKLANGKYDLAAVRLAFEEESWI